MSRSGTPWKSRPWQTPFALHLRARNIADAAGIELGSVLTISAGGVGPAPRQFLARAEASSVPVAAGELTVRAQVSVVFAIQ